MVRDVFVFLSARAYREKSVYFLHWFARLATERTSRVVIADHRIDVTAKRDGLPLIEPEELVIEVGAYYRVFIDDAESRVLLPLVIQLARDGVEAEFIELRDGECIRHAKT